MQTFIVFNFQNFFRENEVRDENFDEKAFEPITMPYLHALR
jgi:hypothetical protein